MTGASKDKGHQDRVVCCCLGSDTENPILFTGSEDGTVRMWNVKTMECKSVFSKHTGAICCLCPADDGVMSGSTDRSIIQWSSGGEIVRSFTGLRDSVRCISISGDSLVAGCSDGTVRIFALSGEGQGTDFEPHRDLVSCLLFGPNEDGSGQWLYSASYDKIIKAWDLSQTPPLKTRTFSGHDNHVRSLAFGAPEGSILYSASRDLSIRLWSPATGLCLLVLPLPHPVNVLVAGGSTRQPVVYCGSGDGVVRVLMTQELNERSDAFKKQCQKHFDDKKTELEKQLEKQVKKLRKQMEKDIEATLAAERGAEAPPPKAKGEDEEEGEEGGQPQEDDATAERRAKLTEQMNAAVETKVADLQRELSLKVDQLATIRDRPLVFTQSETAIDGKSRLVTILRYSGPSILTMCLSPDRRLFLSADNEVTSYPASVKVVKL